MNTCEFCGRDTMNERQPGLDLLCNECLNAERQRQHPPDYIAMAYDDAWRAFSENPKLRGRLISAMRLISRGNLEIRPAGEFFIRSESSDQSGGYLIRPHRDCPCPDAQYGAPRVRGRAACKHQLATWIVRKAMWLSKTNKERKGV